jgi:hypothetical protein
VYVGILFWYCTNELKGGKNSAVSRVGETNLGIIDIPERRLTFGPAPTWAFF